MALVAERGPSDVAMAHIAERAGIGRATLYGYFPDLDHILAAHLIERLGAARDAMRAAIELEPGPLERLRRYVSLTVAAFGEDQARAIGAGVTFDHFGPALHAEIDAAFGLLRSLLAEILAEGRERGTFRADLDPERAAELLFHLVGGARRLVMAGDDVASVEAETVALVVGAVIDPPRPTRRRDAKRPGP